MALPKRRHSKTRRDKRRTHWKTQATAVSSCPQCGSGMRPHHVCATCGFYGGKKAIEVDVS